MKAYIHSYGRLLKSQCVLSLFYFGQREKGERILLKHWMEALTKV